MEPPRLSSLQACPSLLPIGGVAASGSSSAISTSSAISSSSMSQVHTSTVSSTGYTQPKLAPRNLAQQPYKPSSSVNSPSNNTPHQQLPTVSQQTGATGQNMPLFIIQSVYPNGQPQDSVQLIDQKQTTETKMIKTLLAKKLRTNAGPVPICPKTDQANPMQLLTFTTQQGTVIQEQLQQPYMMSQAVVPQVSTTNQLQTVDTYQQGQTQLSVNMDNVQYSYSPVLSPAGSVSSVVSSQSLPNAKPKKKKKSGQSSPKRSASPKGKPNKDLANKDAIIENNTVLNTTQPSTISSTVFVQGQMFNNIDTKQNANLLQTTDIVQTAIDQTNMGLGSGNVFPSVLDLAVSAAGIGEDSMSSVDMDQNSTTYSAQVMDTYSQPIYVTESSITSPTETSVGLPGTISTVINFNSNNQNIPYSFAETTSDIKPESVIVDSDILNKAKIPGSDTVNNVDKQIAGTVVNKQDEGIDNKEVEIAKPLSLEDVIKPENVLQIDGVNEKLVTEENGVNGHGQELIDEECENYLENLVSDPSPVSVNTKVSSTNMNGHSESQISEQLNENIINGGDNLKLQNHIINQNQPEIVSKKSSEHPPLVNGDCKYDDEELIPSPLPIMNGIDKDLEDESTMDKEALELSKTQQIKENLKKIYEKMGKVNGVQSVLQHVENGDIDDDSNDMDYEMAEEDLDDDLDDESPAPEPQEESVNKDDVPGDVQHVVIHAGENDSVVIDSQGRLEINGKVTDMDELPDATEGSTVADEQDLAIASILGGGPVEGQENTGTNEQFVTADSECLELAGEPDDSQAMEVEDIKPTASGEASAAPSTTGDQESEEVIIENEMCLKPTPCSISSAVDQAVAELMEGASPLTDMEESQDAPIQPMVPNASNNMITVIPKVLDSNVTIMNQTMTQVVTTNQLGIGTTYAVAPGNYQTAVISQPLIGQPMIGQTFIGQPYIGQTFTAAPVVQQPVLQFKSVKDLVISNDSAIKMGLKTDQFIYNQPTNVVAPTANYCVVSQPGTTFANTIGNYTVGTFEVDQSKCQPLEICSSSRHVPTPEASRDSEYSCDSIASSITDSQDKHSSVSQGSATSSGKPSPVSTTTTTSSASSKRSRPKSGEKKSGEKKSKKRSRNSSGGSDSRASTSPAPSTAPPALKFMCDWAGCKM